MQIFVPLKVSRINIERANDYFPIREAYFELTTKESEELAEYPKLREQLNKHYDTYVRKWAFSTTTTTRSFSLGIVWAWKYSRLKCNSERTSVKPTSCTSLLHSRK